MMKKKLINLLCQAHNKATDASAFECANYAQQLEVEADTLIANGAIVFPCKIGDEFWTEWVGICKVRCSMLTQKADGSLKGRFTVERSCGASIDVDFTRGNHRNLFLTKEAAEAHFCGERREGE